MSLFSPEPYYKWPSYLRGLAIGLAEGFRRAGLVEHIFPSIPLEEMTEGHYAILGDAIDQFRNEHPSTLPASMQEYCGTAQKVWRYSQLIIRLDTEKPEIDYGPADKIYFGLYPDFTQFSYYRGLQIGLVEGLRQAGRLPEIFQGIHQTLFSVAFQTEFQFEKLCEKLNQELCLFPVASEDVSSYLCDTAIEVQMLSQGLIALCEDSADNNIQAVAQLLVAE